MEKQLLKHLYRHLSKIIVDHSQRDYELFERADRIVIWIVGFSIGVFVLLIGKEINPTLPIPVRGVIEASLVIVILGLIYRLFSFFTTWYLIRVNINFSSYTELATNFPELPHPRIIEEKDTLDDIIFYLKEDFNHEVDKNYSSVTVEQKTELRRLYNNFYDSLASTNDIDSQFEEFNNTVARFYGLNEKKIDKRALTDKTKITGKRYRVFLYLSYIFFFLTIGSFIAATLNVLLHFIEQ